MRAHQPGRQAAGADDHEHGVRGARDHPCGLARPGPGRPVAGLRRLVEDDGDSPLSGWMLVAIGTAAAVGVVLAALLGMLFSPRDGAGEIEILGLELEILNVAQTPPFQLDQHSEAGEDVRLRYRYMDLRRPEMQNRMQMRAAISSQTRRYLEEDQSTDYIGFRCAMDRVGFQNESSNRSKRPAQVKRHNFKRYKM